MKENKKIQKALQQLRKLEKELLKAYHPNHPNSKRNWRNLYEGCQDLGIFGIDIVSEKQFKKAFEKHPKRILPFVLSVINQDPELGAGLYMRKSGKPLTRVQFSSDNKIRFKTMHYSSGKQAREDYHNNLLSLNATVKDVDYLYQLKKGLKELSLNIKDEERIDRQLDTAVAVLKSLDTLGVYTSAGIREKTQEKLQQSIDWTNDLIKQKKKDIANIQQKLNKEETIGEIMGEAKHRDDLRLEELEIHIANTKNAIEEVNARSTKEREVIEDYTKEIRSFFDFRREMMQFLLQAMNVQKKLHNMWEIFGYDMYHNDEGELMEGGMKVKEMNIASQLIDSWLPTWEAYLNMLPEETVVKVPLKQMVATMHEFITMMEQNKGHFEEGYFYKMENNKLVQDFSGLTESLNIQSLIKQKFNEVIKLGQESLSFSTDILAFNEKKIKESKQMIKSNRALVNKAERLEQKFNKLEQRVKEEKKKKIFNDLLNILDGKGE